MRNAVLASTFLLVSTCYFSLAHEPKDLHKICKGSRDYEGCMDFNSKEISELNARAKELNQIRNYGPLQVDWSGWISKQGSYLAPSLNQEGKPLYLALNCDKGKLNVTGKNGTWKGWSVPKLQFERRLLKDLCTEKQQKP